jgi:putative ABC transport system permease protein
VLLFAPAGITLLGVIGRRSPIAARLALRDLGRYGSRSGPALAAISFAVFIAMIVGLLATARYADPVDYFAPNLPADQLIVYPPGNGPADTGPGPGFIGKQSGQAGQPPAGQAAAQVAQSIATSLGSHDVLALDTTDATMVTARSGMLLSGPGMIYVATPALLSRYGIDPATIDPDALLITSRPGLEKIDNLQLRRFLGPGDPDCTPATCIAHPKVQRVAALPTGASAPNLLVTQHAVDTLHLTPTPAGWLIHAAGPLSPVQINSARQAAVAGGLTIETKSDAPSLAQLRNYAAVGGILLALAVLAMTVGLIRGEAASDLRTLAANGASERTRRAITAATAGALGLTGALLGTVIAYGAVIALFRSQLSERLTPPPILDIALVVIGLPVVATIGSWLLAGREPAAVSRQPIE